MDPAHLLLPVQIRERPRHAQDAVVAAGGEADAFDRPSAATGAGMPKVAAAATRAQPAMRPKYLRCIFLPPIIGSQSPGIGLTLYQMMDMAQAGANTLRRIRGA